MAAGLVPPPLTGKDKSSGGNGKSGGSKKKKATANNNSTTNNNGSSTSNGGGDSVTTSGETTSIPIFEIPISSMCPSASGAPTTVTASVNIPRTSISAGNTTIIHVSGGGEGR